MSHAVRPDRIRIAGATDGSRTITIHDIPTPERSGCEGDPSAGPSNQPHGVLRLRGADNPPSRRVVWTDDTVDNEHLGKKSSKICCIYHKPRAFDESSSSGSESDTDSETDSSAPPSDSECNFVSSSDGPRLSSGMKEKFAAAQMKGPDIKGKGKSKEPVEDGEHRHEEGQSSEACGTHVHGRRDRTKSKSAASRRQTQRRSGRTVVITRTEEQQDTVQASFGEGGGGADTVDDDELAKNAYERGPM